MKYLIRSLKYYVQLLLILCVFIAVLMAFKIVDTDLDTLFINGKDSFWQIALIMAVFAAIYPRMGYTTRRVRIGGSFDEVLPVVMKVLTARGYSLKERDGENLIFRLNSVAGRIARMGEDKITFTRQLSGFDVEGLTKDVVRIISLFTDIQQEDE